MPKKKLPGDDPGLSRTCAISLTEERPCMLCKENAIRGLLFLYATTEDLVELLYLCPKHDAEALADPLRVIAKIPKAMLKKTLRQFRYPEECIVDVWQEALNAS
jgi:hypothetical protein